MPGTHQKLRLVFWPFRSRSKQCENNPLWLFDLGVASIAFHIIYYWITPRLFYEKVATINHHTSCFIWPANLLCRIFFMKPPWKIPNGGLATQSLQFNFRLYMINAIGLRRMWLMPQSRAYSSGPSENMETVGICPPYLGTFGICLHIWGHWQILCMRHYNLLLIWNRFWL